MMHLYKIILCFFCLIISIQSLNAQQSKELVSPNGKLVYSFVLTKEGTPVYSITYNQKPFILKSALGLDGWQKGFVLSGVTFLKKRYNMETLVWRKKSCERPLSSNDHYAV